MGEDTSFLYPEEEKHRKRANTVNAIVPLIILAAVMSIDRKLLLILLPVQVMLYFTGLPGKAYYAMLRNNHYSLVEREMPYFVLHLLIASSSSLSIEEAFSRVEPQVFFKAFKKEYVKLKAILRTGRSLEHALEKLAEQSTSRTYTRFLRGLVTIISTSNEVPRYSYDYLKTITKMLEEKWKNYWKSITGIIEVALLIGLAVITMTFVSATIARDYLWLFSEAVSGAAVLTSLVLYASASGMKPVVEGGPGLRESLASIASLFISVFLAILLARTGQGRSIQLTVASMVLVLSSLPMIHEKRVLGDLEQRVIGRFKEMVELEKSGYSIGQAIEKTGYREAYEEYIERGGRSFKVLFIDSMIRLVWEMGGGSKRLFDKINYFVSEIDWLERRGKTNGFFSTTLSILLPPLLYLFSKNTLGRLGLLYSGVDATSALIMPFVSIALSTNIVISLLYDNTLSLWRPGGSLMLLGLIDLLSP